MERLAEDKHGDAEPRFFLHVALDPVNALRFPDRRVTLEEETRTEASRTGVERRGVLHSDKVPVLVERKRVPGEIPVQLGDLLVQRHAAEKVFYPLTYRK